MFSFASMAAQKKQAEAYSRMADRAMRGQIEASERAAVEMQYLGLVDRPEMVKRGGRWCAVFWGRTNIPKVTRHV